jgi:putative membrane protein
MAGDHRKINDRLTAIAAGRNMTLPATMTAKQQALYDNLQNLTGRDFDKAYTAGMVKEHERNVVEFRREANRGQDDRIKSFASEILPVLEGQLQKIKSIHSGT